VIVERPAVERRVAASLDAGRIPVVLGGCGAGLTSLLLRLEAVAGRDRAQYIDLAAAATTPERCLALVRAARRAPPVAAPLSTTAAFAGLVDYLDEPSVSGQPLTYLLDEFLDLRTFESFPGLRHVARDFVARLAASPSRFVLASRFTNRVHRLLRDASARFEVVHLPPMDGQDVRAAALGFDGGRREWAGEMAPPVAALSGGRAAAVHLLLGALASMGPATDPVAALAGLFAPDAALTARCRESYEFRLHRARGYGALKAILGVLADQEPLNLTEISQRLQRTPGSTKDYLSWLEDVDLVSVQGKRYSLEDPLLRLYVRLYGRATPPTDDEIVREVSAYAKTRLPIGKPAAAPPPSPLPTRPMEPVADGASRSGIIEID